MKIFRISGILIALLFASLTMIPNARATELNGDLTRLTFNQPIRIPGKVLPAGTYWFMIPDSYADPNVVAIYNAHRTHVDAVLLTRPTLRVTPTSRTELMLAEQGRRSPNALVKWFYPGTVYGQAFIYSHRTQRRLNEDTTINVFAHRQPIASLG